MANFDIKEQTIEELFSKKREQLLIPKNQRNYVWTKQNWEELYFDIIDNMEKEKEGEKILAKTYFLGSCILEENEKEKTKLNIIDGQQRITTIITLLSVIYDFAKKNEESLELITKEIEDYFVKKTLEKEKFYMLKNEKLSPYLEENIFNKEDDRIQEVPKNDSQKNLENCFNFYKEIFEKNEEKEKEKFSYFLTKFYEQLINLRIIVINTNNEVDGYTIFEILNARGQKLDLFDKIRNLLLKKMQNNEYNYAEIALKEIEEILLGENLEKFFQIFYTIIDDKVKLDQIFYNLKTKLNKNEIEIKVFLQMLKTFAKIYKEIRNPKKNENYFFEFSFFKNARIFQIIPTLLVILELKNRKKLTPSKVDDIIEKLEKFHLKYNSICKEPTNILEKTYQQYPKILWELQDQKSKLLEKIEEFLKSVLINLPKDETVKANLKEMGFSNKRESKYRKNDYKIKYLLKKILNKDLNTKELQLNEISIEHIMNDKGEYLTSQLGNLLPLSTKLNNNLKDTESFIKKKLIYRNSKLSYVENFVKKYDKVDLWDNSEIEKRTDEVIEEILLTLEIK